MSENGRLIGVDLGVKTPAQKKIGLPEIRQMAIEKRTAITLDPEEIAPEELSRYSPIVRGALERGIAIKVDMAGHLITDPRALMPEQKLGARK